VQLAGGIVALLTGLVVLAYGGASLVGLRAVHYWVTYPIAGALLWHWLAPKQWR
jgi:hypothetical protein